MVWRVGRGGGDHRAEGACLVRFAIPSRPTETGGLSVSTEVSPRGIRELGSDDTFLGMDGGKKRRSRT